VLTLPARPPARPCPRRGDRRHLGDDVGQDHLPAGSDPLGRRQAHAPRPAGELEHALAGPRARQLEHLRGQLGAARVGVFRVLAPPACNRRPHAVKVSAEVVAGALGDDGAGVHRRRASR
jgi:hypothetical protein